MRGTFLSLFIVLSLTLGSSVWAQSSRYEQWGGQETSKNFASELRKLIDEAERARAADPRFLDDLRALAGRYDNPWSSRLIEEHFRDGDYARNPTWTVASGSFSVGFDGLKSAVNAQTAQQEQPRKLKNRDIAIALLGQMLNQGSGGGNQQAAPEPAQPEGPAEIFLTTSINNAFSFNASLTGTGGSGGVIFGLYQGAQRQAGYWLYAIPGRGIELLRISSRGAVTLARSDASLAINDGKKHSLGWVRSQTGTMTVSLDGNALFKATDTGFRQAFDGVSLINRGGSYSLHSLIVDGG